MDIADVAGVSTATVSRVLNGKDGVSEQVRHDVLAALDMLGYERPAALSPKPHGLVGVVVPELTNPIFAEFATRILASLSNHGYTPLLCSQSPGGATEDECIALLVDRGVRGIVFVSGLHADTTASHEHYTALTNMGIVVTFVNGFAPEVDASCFASDDMAAINQSMNHLRQLGHTRVALLVGPRRFVPVQRKIAAFCASIADHVSSPDAHVYESLFTIEGGHNAALRAIADGHTALVCASDMMALGAVRGARSLGLSVPGDVSVMGYDDCSLAVFFDPALTTVRQPVGSIVSLAVSTLTHEIEGVPGPREEFLFRPEVVVRQSTGAAPGQTAA